MSAITATDLGAFLGRSVNTAQADSVIAVVTSLARGYTRGAGFTDEGPSSDIGAVIISASARMISNTKQLDTVDTYGPQSYSVRGAFTGWTVAELFALNRYRVTAR